MDSSRLQANLRQQDRKETLSTSKTNKSNLRNNDDKIFGGKLVNKKLSKSQGEKETTIRLLTCFLSS
jgi:hypothetical protein